MIRFVTGDLLTSGARVLVNPVNCAGVMGKGLALQFRQTFPAYFDDYRRACSARGLDVGHLHVFRTLTHTIISLPTKRHWRGAARLNDVVAGIEALTHWARELERGTTVACPKLGCGEGGLAWSDVRPLLIERFAAVPEVEWMVFGEAG